MVGNLSGSCAGTFEFFQDFLLKPGGFLDATVALKRADLFRFAGIQFDHVGFVADELRGQKYEEIELLYLTALRPKKPTQYGNIPEEGNLVFRDQDVVPYQPSDD